MSYVTAADMLYSTLKHISENLDQPVDKHTIKIGYSTDKIIQFTYTLISANFVEGQISYEKVSGAPKITCLKVTDTGYRLLLDCQNTMVWSKVLEELTILERVKTEGYFKPILTVGDILNCLNKAKNVSLSVK
jgi:hypothetical protein